MASREMLEFFDGVAFWHGRMGWPGDFHNAQYERWDRRNPGGNFSETWWEGFLPSLQAWKATRGFSGTVLTARFVERTARLSTAWQEACLPHLDGAISTVCDQAVPGSPHAVSWDDVKAFPAVVAEIKPTRRPSVVFTSKFCHFLLPQVFPVVDRRALQGGRWSYAYYFDLVQREWALTDPAARAELVAELRRLVELGGHPMYARFPVVNKIVELRLIGRNHPRAT